MKKISDIKINSPSHKPDVTAKRHKCRVCGYETNTPKIDLMFSSPFRCADVTCGGPTEEIKTC